MKDEELLRYYLPLLQPYCTPNSSILDLGCGTGLFLQILREAGYQQVYGVDISRFALKKTNNDSGNQSVWCQDLQSTLAAQDQQFDCIVLLDVIEHIETPALLLREIARALKPGGITFITTPNANSILRYLRGSQWYALADSTHVLYYNRFSLEYLLSKSGLEPKRTITYSRIPPLRWLGTGGQLCTLAQRLVVD
ncbi:MAG: class I SAM-dependent methyltransferase [Chloroflexota bacterium]|nr:class I SAM-dependent methyltransferase [Chloroflexota bacterium]